MPRPGLSLSLPAGPSEARKVIRIFTRSLGAPERSSKYTRGPVTGTQKSPARKSSSGQMAVWTSAKPSAPPGQRSEQVWRKTAV